MEVIDLSLIGLKLVKPKIFKDHRGFFIETYHRASYEKAGIKCPFVQDNHSFSCQGCLRGMHFQSEHKQAKLIRVGKGKIYDVVVDIRQDSPTYGQWEAMILDDVSHDQLFIPEGFAHGFCVLSEEAHVMYKVSTPYDFNLEKSFRWNDPYLNIKWPIENPIISERDEQAPFFNERIPERAEQGRK